MDKKQEALRERLKQLRMELKLTQIKFAQRIAISTSYISEVESGIKSPNERIIRLVIAEFNVNEEWLRHGKGEMFAKGMDGDVTRLISLFTSLDRRLQVSALRLLEELCNFQEGVEEQHREE